MHGINENDVAELIDGVLPPRRAARVWSAILASAGWTRVYVDTLAVLREMGWTGSWEPTREYAAVEM